MGDLPLRLASGVILVGAVLALAGCARPVGDLGSVGPAPYGSDAQRLSTATSGKPVLSPTDEERRMHDLVWRFEQAPYAKDWVLSNGYWPARGKQDAYFRWLSTQPYASSQTRYRMLGDHLASDLEMLPKTFAAICAVEGQDHRRDVAGQGVTGVEEGLRAAVAARQAENRLEVERFAGALAYRYDAFSYALDQLLVVTPQQQAVTIDARLGQLAQWVDRANADDFCAPAWSPGGGGQAALPSRVLLDREQQPPPK